MDTENPAAETAQRIFADFADPNTINKSKDGKWKAPLWSALAEAGLPLAWVPEEYGGSGGELEDGFAIMAAAGRAGVSVPLAETMLAGWLLSQGGIASPARPMTIAPADPRDTISLTSGGKLKGRARRVPFAEDVDFVALLANQGDNCFIVLADKTAGRIEPAKSLAGDAIGTIIFDDAASVAHTRAPAGFDRNAIMLMGAAACSLKMAGALETILSLCVRYSDERVAFAKKISKFQAIQHSLAKLASETAAAVAVAASAADAIASGKASEEAVFLEVASAKIRCGEAMEKGAAIAHQVHGAIGFSLEHILHRYTLRGLSWRDQFGDESHWALELGKRTAKLGGERLWPLISSR